MESKATTYNCKLVTEQMNDSMISKQSKTLCRALHKTCMIRVRRHESMPRRERKASSIQSIDEWTQRCIVKGLPLAPLIALCFANRSSSDVRLGSLSDEKMSILAGRSDGIPYFVPASTSEGTRTSGSPAIFSSVLCVLRSVESFSSR